MKKYLFFQQIFCCGFTMPLFLISLSIFAQKDIITYPVEGSIFQKDINNNATINIAGQIETTSTLYYKITQKRGSGCGSCGTEQTINNANITAWNMGRKGFHLSLGSLPKGWYSVQLYSKRGFWIFKQNVNLNSKEFGIGDVYFIAGQSNAAGYIGTTDPNSPNDDNPNPFLNNFTQNESARVYKVSSDFGNNSTVSKGLPYFKENQSTPNKFEIFRNGTNKVTDPMPIYPNGSASWCWSSLAKKISDGGTPVMFFNLAYAGSSVNQDWATSQTSPLMYKFSKTLKMYGNVLGAKAVLWHQGERDSQILTLSSTNQTNYLNSYETGLSDIINWSRQALKDDITKNLNWYISKASFTTGPSVDGGFGIGPNRTNPGIFSSNPNCLPTDNGYTTQKEKNNNLISKQINLYNSANRIFQGVDTDDDEECDRATNWRIHFSGNTLEDLATEWKQAIDNSNTNNSISPTPLIKLEQVSVNGSAYTLTVTELSPPPVPEINTYYWVKNDAGIDNAVASTNNNSYTFSSTSSDDFLTCYIKNGSGRLFACQPFIVPGGTFDGKSIVVSNPSLTFSSGSNESKEVTVISTNVEWDLTSVPSWVNVDINENDSKVRKADQIEP